MCVCSTAHIMLICPSDKNIHQFSKNLLKEKQILKFISKSECLDFTLIVMSQHRLSLHKYEIGEVWLASAHWSLNGPS